MEIRTAGPDDVAAIGAVSLAVGQPPDDSGASPRYVDLLMATGQVLVASAPSTVVGWGAVRETAWGSMLTDLFVDPIHQGGGVGSALMSALWPTRSAPRFTFSSQDPRALPVYARTGLQASWPLLYMSGDPELVTASDASHRVSPSSALEAGAVEASYTGFSRDADYAYWLGFPGSDAITIHAGAQVVAAGVIGPEMLMHLAVDADAEPVGPLVAALQAIDSRDVKVFLPGVHPALGSLLDARFRIDDYDIHMCTPDARLPVGWAYSPGLG
jgi:GNAT superfamily N-acetyltransferase